MIRKARAADAEVICAIHNRIIEETLITFTTELRTVAAVKDEIALKSAAFLVAEVAGEVVGFASFGPFRSGPGYRATREHSILLDQRVRGKGLGRSLMQVLEDEAQRQGVHVLVAGISSANETAQAFHESLGFEEVGRMPEVGRKWDQWLDLILMQKRLASGIAPDSRGRAR